MDDDELLTIAQEAGAEAVMTSPDCASGTDRIAEAVREADVNSSVIVNVQGDEPEIPAETVLAAANVLNEVDAPMGTLVALVDDPAQLNDPAVVKVVTSTTGNALYFSRAPIPFPRDGESDAPVLRHIGIYAYRREFLLGYADLPPSKLERTEKLEQLRALEAGHAIRVAVVDRVPVGIDTPEDYAAFVDRCRQTTA